MALLERDETTSEFMQQTEEQAALSAMHVWAVDHALRGSGRLSVMEANHPEFPTSLTPFETSAETVRDADFIEDFITEIEPRFAQMKEMLQSPENEEYLNECATLLASGENVLMACNHGDAEDLIILHSLLVGEIAKRTIFEPSDDGETVEASPVDFRTATIMAHMQRFLLINTGTEEEPEYHSVASVVGQLEDETFYSFPESDSLEEYMPRDEFGDFGDRSNRTMARPLVRSMLKGGLLFGLSPSGSTDKLDPNDPSVSVIPEVSEATAKIMCLRKNHVLPIGFTRQDGEPIIYIGAPRQTDSVNDVHAMMHLMAEGLDQQLDDRSYRYPHVFDNAA